MSRYNKRLQGHVETLNGSPVDAAGWYGMDLDRNAGTAVGRRVAELPLRNDGRYQDLRSVALALSGDRLLLFAGELKPFSRKPRLYAVGQWPIGSVSITPIERGAGRLVGIHLNLPDDAPLELNCGDSIAADAVLSVLARSPSG
jgi:hypothetical protein